jgi:hypothetical protein
MGMNRKKTNSETITGQQRDKPSSLEGKKFLQGARLVILGLFFSLSACEAVSYDVTKDFEKIKETKSMEVTQTNIVHTPTIPPIDVSAPTRTETATFALG